MFLPRVKSPSYLLDRFLTWISPGAGQPGNLVEITEAARQAWHQARREMDFINGDMTDHVIFKINATERRYMALLQQARNEGVKAWTQSAEADDWRLGVERKDQMSLNESTP